MEHTKLLTFRRESERIHYMRKLENQLNVFYLLKQK